MIPPARYSTNFAKPSVDDYADRTKDRRASKSVNVTQGGDPAKLADALVRLARQDEPPPRWPVGADAVEALELKARTLIEQANASRELSSSLALDKAK